MRSTSRFHIFCGMTTLLATLSVGSPDAQSQHVTPTGTYINNEQSTDAIHAAINENVESAPFVFRSIVRKGLLEVCPAYRRVSIQQTDNEINVTFDSAKPLRMRADGSAIKWTNDDGDSYDVSAKWQDGQLMQVFKGKKGDRVHTFHVSADRQVLTLLVTITGERLTAPIHYELTFRSQSQ